MASLSHFPLKTLPISLRRNYTPNSTQCEFVLTMSHEMALQLSLIAAPFLRDLGIAVEQRKMEQAEHQRTHLRLETADKIVRWVGLRAMHVARRVGNAETFTICEEMAMLENLNPQAVYCAAMDWKDRRFKRVRRFRDREIIHQYALGKSKKDLAKQYKTTIWDIRRILGEPPRMRG